MGEKIYELRKKIYCIKLELEALSAPNNDMPELIISANLLRSNESLKKTNQKQSDLLSLYDQYSEALEKMLLDVFDIQHDLKDILKEQSSLISTAATHRKKPGKINKASRKLK